MSFLFWLFMFLIFYTYLGYPLVLQVWARIKSCPVSKKEFEPNVSVIIAAWNEGDVILRRIKNLLNLDYPPDRLEILVGSDGSSDKTVEIVKSFSDPRVRCAAFYERRGKVSVLNDLAAKARHDILVFTDSRQTFAPGAIRNLVCNFADQTVGCVSGELLLSDSDGGTGKGINLYWKYEKFMRSCESRIHSMIGATGAIYAIRRELFEKIPSDVILDDVYIPLMIIRKGFRAVYDDTAKAYDKVTEDPNEETRRKVRTLCGNYQIFSLFKDLFLPVKSPVALQFFSHKALRVTAPFFLIMIFIFNISLADQSLLYFWMVWLQVLFYSMAFLGAVFRDEFSGPGRFVKNICYIPYVFCLLNFSAFLGFIRFILKDQDVRWDKARS